MFPIDLADDARLFPARGTHRAEWHASAPDGSPSPSRSASA
ncbi:MULTISPECIES: hypothetical protein [Streptomyces]|nr:hypothetical protein [Streptomyces flavotricini]